MMFNTFKEAESYIFDIPRFSGKNEPEVTKQFLNMLGDLSKEIPTVHVAGTNGKGSVCAYLRAGLLKAGLSVGLFTSPHLVSVCERFNYNGTDMTEEEFLECANKVAASLETFRSESGHREYHPSFFEYVFFMGIIWFWKKKPDVLILETGLGGRLDATNSVSDPRVCVITEIGFDHMEYLGDTKEQIAFEKAGIIKPSAYVAFVSKDPRADAVIEGRAKENSKGLIKVSPANIKNLETRPFGIDFSCQYGYDSCADFSLNTKAVYQVENASLAYAALMLLKRSGVSFDLDSARAGFKEMVWPCRMEEALPGLFVDGAHNEDGIKAFLESASGLLAGKKGSLLFAMVADKQVETVGAAIADSGLFDRIYICRLDTPRFAGISRLSAVFDNREGISVETFETVSEAFSHMQADAGTDRYRFVAGSLYLAGEVRALLS